MPGIPVLCLCAAAGLRHRLPASFRPESGFTAHAFPITFRHEQVEVVPSGLPHENRSKSGHGCICSPWTPTEDCDECIIPMNQAFPAKTFPMQGIISPSFPAAVSPDLPAGSASSRMSQMTSNSNSSFRLLHRMYIPYRSLPGCAARISLPSDFLRMTAFREYCSGSIHSAMPAPHFRSRFVRFIPLFGLSLSLSDDGVAVPPEQ